MHLRVGSKEKEINDCCEIWRTDSSYITGIHTLSRSFLGNYVTALYSKIRSPSPHCFGVVF